MRVTASLLPLAIAALPVLARAPEAPAQVPDRTLANPDASFPDAFSLVRGVRELSDGRVLVADPLGQALVAVDFATGRGDTLGRVGGGPGEYRQPDNVLPLPGDSTLMVDLGNSRLAVVDPDGGFGETMPIARPGAGGPGGMTIVMPQAVDARGRIYYRALGGRSAAADSAPILRWDRPAGVTDTVAYIGLPRVEQRTSGGRGNVNTTIRPRPLSPEDGWTVTPDGRVAVVRAADYHVEWIHPDGRVGRGPAIAYRPVPVREADKRAWVESMRNGLRVMVSVENGRPSMQMSRGGGPPAEVPDLDAYEWPEHKPPFVANGVWATAEGDLWVQRSVPAGEPAQYDVFGPVGRPKERVTLPPERRLVGFGRGAVYLVRVDEFDLQWLERYRLRG